MQPVVRHILRLLLLVSEVKQQFIDGLEKGQKDAKGPQVTAICQY